MAAGTPRSSTPPSRLLTPLGVLATGALLGCLWPAVVSAQTVTPAVAFGERHALALRSNGDVLSWGDNVMCQLGRRTSGNTDPTPVLVLRNATAIAAAAKHALVLTADAAVYGWGMNPHGALGTGRTRDECEGPVRISSLDGQTITHIATGQDFSVAVTRSGDLYCAGDNAMGQCPAAPRNGRSETFARVPIPELTGQVAAVAAGAFHALVLTKTGTLYAFGRGNDGQLGTGATSSGSGAVAGLTNVVAVSAGLWHSAAVQADGSVWLWGRNQRSQLCDGTTATHAVPAKVAFPAGVRITTVAAGHHGTLLRAADGTLFACGDNQFGALGADQPAVVARPAVVTQAAHASVLAVSGANGAFSADGCDVRIAGDNDAGLVSSGRRAAAPFTLRANLSLCAPRAAQPLDTVAAERPSGGASGCWTPIVHEDAAAHARSATRRKTLLAARAILERNAALLAAPEPVRLRTTLSIGASGGSARMHVKAVPERKTDGTRLWTGDCDVIPQIDRVGGVIAQVSIFINPDPRGVFISHTGAPPVLTGEVGGYPEYSGWVLLTRNGRLPWIPETLAERLDEEGARRRAALDDWRRSGIADPARTAALEKQIRDYAAYRASFTPAQLQAPAVWGDPTGRGREQLDAEATARRQAHGADAVLMNLDALAQYDLRNLQPGDAARAMRVKPDPAFPGAGDSDGIHLIAVRLPEEPGSQQPERRAWRQRVRETFDMTALAALLAP